MDGSVPYILRKESRMLRMPLWAQPEIRMYLSWSYLITRYISWEKVSWTYSLFFSWCNRLFPLGQFRLGETLVKTESSSSITVRSNITLEAEWTEDAKNQRNRVEKSVRFLFLLISSLYAALDLEVDEGLPMKNKENETYELFSVEGYSGMQEPDVSVL